MKEKLMSEYVLQVGRKGFDRLKFINGVFGEHSRNFLNRAGLKTGSRVLELGCGTGSMTTWLAESVGEGGRVIAVDASESQIAIARRAAEGAGAGNVDFICSTVEALELPGDSIDLAYSRLLLMHVKNPTQALTRVMKFLRPGGVMACEEPHSSSMATTPRNERIEKLNEVFVKLGKLQGLDFNVGDRLLPLLRSAGYSDVHACFIQPVISMAEAADFVRMGAVEVAPFAVKCGMASEAETQQVLHELEICEFDKDSYYTFPRQAQVFGYKE
jgi:ubiquinone/menaquinone biosynthesis C-methylase UbiE